MKLLNNLYLVFLLETATPCSIPPLARYLYMPPTITSPKENGILPRKKIKFMWTPASPRSIIDSTLNFLFDVSYKLEIKKRKQGKNSSQDYETKALFIVLPSAKYLGGQYLARVAATGVFGSGDWSKIIQFEIVDAWFIDEEVGLKNNSDSVSKPGQSGQSPSKKPKVSFVPRVTARPEIIVPENGSTVEIGEILIQWTRILNASGYLVQLKHVDSSDSMDYQLSHTYCDKCLTAAVGMHVVKVAGIVADEFSDWGQEVHFNVLGHLDAPRMISPKQNSMHQRTVEFEWTEVQGAEKYELFINNPGEPIRIQTYYTFYNMWQVKYVNNFNYSHNASVSACDSTRASAWSETVSFKVKDTSSILFPEFTSSRGTDPHHFMFQPVSKEWMLRKCDEHMGDLCNKNMINRAKTSPIKLSNLDKPQNSGVQFVGGNSFYSAVSHAISDSGDHQKEVRDFVMQELNMNHMLYLRDTVDVITYTRFNSPLDDNRRPSDVEVVAAANGLQTVIWVYDESRPVSAWIDYQPRVCEHKEAVYLRKTQTSDYSVIYKFH